MECESPECKADLIEKITEVENCCTGIGNKLDSKLGLRNFGIAAFCLAVPIFAYLIAINVLVADCADEEDFADFKTYVTKQTTEIKGDVKAMRIIFEDYMKRTEKRDSEQEEETKENRERIIKLEVQ